MVLAGWRIGERRRKMRGEGRKESNSRAGDISSFENLSVSLRTPSSRSFAHTAAKTGHNTSVTLETQFLNRRAWTIAWPSSQDGRGMEHKGYGLLPKTCQGRQKHVWMRAIALLSWLIIWECPLSMWILSAKSQILHHPSAGTQCLSTIRATASSLTAKQDEVPL